MIRSLQLLDNSVLSSREQNKKLQEQSSLLQNLIDFWNSFIRALGVSK